MDKITNITPILLTKPSEQKSAKGVKGVDEAILQSNFVTLIVGKPGSGKSFILREFILNKQLYNKKFALVLFITPSMFEDKEITLDERNTRKNVDTEWILSTLDKYKSFNEEKDGEKISPVRNILIIFDDVIAGLKKKETDPRLI
jgi:ABC-type dipeptide/oligopeptide/nickel transport system ATPase component